MDQVDKAGSESEWVSVSDAARGQFAHHPWSVSGGGADDLKAHIESASGRLADVVDEIGYGAVTREDEAYMLGDGALRRARVSTVQRRPLVEGDVVRDFRISNPVIAFWPYDSTTLDAFADGTAQSLLWPYRAILRIRVAYGQTQLERGLTWFEYSMFFRKRFRSPFILTFAFVSTHNHFVLDRGGKVFKQTAPVIKLSESATEDDYLALLGVLNSSTACFWLKQICQNRGSTVDAHGARQTTIPWEDFYEIAGGLLKELPLPGALPLERGRELDSLAQHLAAASTCEEDNRLRIRMIAQQEELDWDVYHRYGLLTDAQAADLTADPATVPNLNLGERAFEIVMARKMERGELGTQWFARHRSTPIAEIPKDWPEPYRQVVERRIEIIETNRNIGLIERPECKRRWQSDPWEEREAKRLTTWLLDRSEERSLWFDPDGSPRPMTVNRLADRLRTDPEVIAKAREFKGPDTDLADVLKEIIADEHVPFLAAYRYKPTGLAKRAQWERTWDLQREEDRTDKRLDIDVPPKYQGADFQKQSYWRHRGKLDVPKERFISYPNVSPDSDKDSLLIGWAGWDHKDQATALITLIEDRATTDGWDTDRLTPLLAGLQELMPWLHQWHNEMTDLGQSYADAYDAYLTSQREQRNLPAETLRTWLPPEPRRGRR